MKPLLPPRNPTPRVDPKWLLPLLLWALMGLVHAQSGVRHADVERELKQTRYEQVLDLTQKALADRPRDPQMRFWRAVALDNLGRAAEALAAYRALTQDHPELPEPHNNLGVMLLRAGHIDEAQAAFELACAWTRATPLPWKTWAMCSSCKPVGCMSNRFKPMPAALP